MTKIWSDNAWDDYPAGLKKGERLRQSLRGTNQSIRRLIFCRLCLTPLLRFCYINMEETASDFQASKTIRHTLITNKMSSLNCCHAFSPSSTGKRNCVMRLGIGQTSAMEEYCNTTDWGDILN